MQIPAQSYLYCRRTAYPAARKPGDLLYGIIRNSEVERCVMDTGVCRPSPDKGEGLLRMFERRGERR